MRTLNFAVLHGAGSTHALLSPAGREWDEMNLEIRYLMLPVKDRDTSVQFFTDKLGFELVSNVMIRDRDCAALRISATGPLLVLEVTDPEEIQPIRKAERIVPNTDDCLRDYYRLKTLGVEFLQKPEYLSVGLTVHFTDPTGNIFALFEKRDYNTN